MAHGKFEFKGTGGSYLWLYIWTAVLTIITAGIFSPWAYSAQQRWISKNTWIDDKQLVFKGTDAGIFGTFLLSILLTLITAGIYAPWGYARLKRWQTNNLYFADPGDVEHTA